MDDQSLLNMLAEKVMPVAVNPEHVAYCPTMDLVALATVDEQVHVFRLNGQRVFGIANKDATCKVKQIRWKPNGRVLAAAFSDHVIRLIDAHTGKAAHQLDCSAHSLAQVCCLGWGLNFTDAESAKSRLRGLGDDVTLDDILSQTVQAYASDAVLDLPKDLASLDVEGALPKLGVLSSGGKEDDVFSSRSSLDAIFHPANTKVDDAADVLVVGFEDGTIHLSIFDFFEIGSFNIRPANPDLTEGKPLLHCSHPYFSSHLLLVSTARGDREMLCVVPLDLRLISSSGRYLSLLASKSTQLHNVLRYINQVQTQMYSELQASQDLPGKFIHNIEETLQEKCSCSWIQAAYHLVVTGNCPAPVKEWLVDELGERGHKRWEKAATTGYENVRRLAHENLLPALERFSVLVSRLRGLSKFQDSNATLGLSSQELNNVLDTVNCLQLLAHNILISAGSELRQFLAFSTWLRSEIETQSADPTSASAEEAAEKENHIDHAKVLEYIEGAMTQSRLLGFFDIQTPTHVQSSWDLAADGTSLYDIYKREHQRSQQGQAPKSKLPGLQELSAHLDVQCDLIFKVIAETQRRNVMFGTPIFLEEYVANAPRGKDMRMVVEHCQGFDKSVAYIAVGPADGQKCVHIYRLVLNIENGVSATEPVELALIRVPQGTVDDIKFVDDEALMLSVTEKSSSRLLNIPYNKMSSSPLRPVYTTAKQHENGTASETVTRLDVTKPDIMDELTWHNFPSSTLWAPEKLEINGRKGRRVICVLARDRLHYRMFDVDSHTRNEAGDDADNI